ncbi:hypothetical protein [Chelatococcus asaccharovorans]|uniref:Uncharacterized protein n=1 Tax=Chelatococcus asaccharovorans TaxID=28210 RepID=A0A2V3TXM2_9HYPH|nr:hypothetical protein [Chelatococcus asaccharovorans]MBS7704648.1 hypothetical protein [Chelatococcus asaccharovorans]PXW54549.1 hypothetical protein C7450_11180 [Chelatococcus asaccharovorans]
MVIPGLILVAATYGFGKISERLFGRRMVPLDDVTLFGAAAGIVGCALLFGKL